MNIGFDENTAVEEYIINIRDKNDVIKHRYALNSKDIEKNSLMSEHYIQLEEFSLDSLVKFVRTDYIIWEGEKYMIKKDYIPDEVNKFNYKYTLRFDHWTTFLQDDTFYYTNQNLEEADWSLMSNAATHFQLIADNANRYFGVNTFNVGTIEFAEMKLLQFSKVSIWDAATQIADAYKAEWYLTGTTFHLVKKFSYGSEVDFESEVSVEKMDRSEGENSEKYSRILAFGSTRNIPANYRKTTFGEAVDAIYQKRLRIPESKGNFIDIRPNLSPEEVKSAVVIFDDIYPKRIGTMSSISTVEYTDTNTDTGEVTKWNAYRYKDTGLQFKEEYLLPGIELRLVFQSGNLNGMDFEVKFNPLGKAETDPQSQLFEIIRNEKYGKALPNDTLKPQNGDTYILYGFNIQLVSDQYIPAGEEELFQTSTQWLADNNKDKSVFECPTLIEYFTDHEMDLEIGQKIKLIHDQFEGGLRSSRIQGYEKHLLDKYQATYTVGDNAAYSWPKEVNESIKELQIAGITYQATGNNGVYLIKQFDNTPASDFNAYSAKASDARYLNRITGGTVQGDTTFYKDVKIQGKTTSNQFGNETFMPGMLGNGFRFWIENGLSYGQLDYLTITREMLISVLTVAEIKSVDGGIIVSAANMVCSKVEELTSGYKCYFDNDNGNIPNKFALGDQAICRRFNGANVKYYWRLVTAIGADYITLSKTDKDGSGIPSAKDNIVQFGNRTNTQRQFAVYTVGYGDAGTYYYYGVNTYDLTGKAKTYFSKEGSRIEGDSIVFTSSGKSASSAINEAQTAANTANAGLLTKVSYSEYNAQMQITNNQIASKVSQTDFNTLGGRVSAAESSITINANNITSVVQKVNDIQIGGRNLALNSKGPFKRTGTGLLKTFTLSSPLSTGEVYTITWKNIKTVGRLASYLDMYGVSDYRQYVVNGISFKANNAYPYLTFYSENADQIDLEIDEIKIEKGNLPGQWDYAPEDVQSGISQAQSTANAKNRTYYQDTEPTAPGGGFIPGDLWYVNSLVDIDGNINTDTGKNIYQLQKRWNGTTWVRINWSVSRSQITQTTESISQLVEKTGINSLGAGETLKSLIDQTPDKIDIAVSSIKIGGRNYALNTGTEWILAKPSTALTERLIGVSDIIKNAVTDNTYTISFEMIPNISGSQPFSTMILGRKYANGDAWENRLTYADFSKLSLSDGYTRFTATFDIKRSQGQNMGVSTRFIAELGNGWGGAAVGGKIRYFQLAEGNKVGSWFPAPEDTQSQIESAQNAANTANNLLSDIASDSKLDPAEKQSTKKEWDVIVSEYSKNVAQANSFSVSVTTYTNAYSSLSSYLTPLLSNLNVTSNIVGNDFRNNFKAYYDARTDLLNAISTKAKAIADSKTTINEVASSLTITNNKISLASKTIELTGTTFAEAIKAGELNVGDGNFYVGQDGKIKAKGATLEGSLEIGWDGDASKPANRITVVDRSSANQKTKVLITPKSITPLNSIGGNTTYPSVVSGGASASGDAWSNRNPNMATWTGATINLPAGKIYDVEIPAIRLEASAANPSTAGFSMFFDNLTTGESSLVVSRLEQTVIIVNQSMTIAGLQPGNYRLRIVVSAWSTTTTDISNSSFYIPANATYTVRPITDAVEIGANGMCGLFTSSRYFHATTDGFFIRMGNYGFRISELNGIQKSTTLNNPTPIWTNL